MAESRSCCSLPGSYCTRVDTLFNLPGTHMIDVGWRDDHLLQAVETGPTVEGCPPAGCSCLVTAAGHALPVDPVPGVMVTDLRHFLDLPPDTPGPARRLSEHLGNIVRAATAGDAGAAWETALPCRGRPANRACPGRMIVVRTEPGRRSGGSAASATTLA